MNIDHRGGAFNTACLRFFVQYLIQGGLCTEVAMHYACLRWFEEVMRSAKLSHQHPVALYRIDDILW